jgi:anti-anti-sigma regulatory factor
MARVEQAMWHRVYPIERHGDTVVVQPRGDAVGFALSAVGSELLHVRQFVESGAVRNLLIDLSSDRYFGSMVIGDLVDLAQLVRSRGGRVGACEVSSDMAKVFELLGLDDQWELFPTRSAGLQALAHIPWSERLGVVRVCLPWMAAAVVLFAAYWWFPRPNYGRMYHAEMSRLWRQTLAQEARHLTAEEWSRAVEKSERELAPLIERMQERKQAGKASEAEQFLLSAGQLFWVPALADRSPDALHARRYVEYFLERARAIDRGGPEPQMPLAPVTPNDGAVTHLAQAAAAHAAMATPLTIIPSAAQAHEAETLPVIPASASTPENLPMETLP